MALADYAAYKDATKTGMQYVFTRSTGTGVTTRLFSHWLNGPDAGATPSTAAACTSSTTGRLLTQPALTSTTNPLYLAQLEMMAAPPQYSGFILCDRLSHQGGLSGTSTAAQTTNLPTAALTRYTGGDGVFAALEVYSLVGTTATTATISYTNQAGTSGRTSKAVAFGGTNNRDVGMVFPMPLQDDDTGVQAVASVTLAASTLTAGNFGVTLYRPLALLPSIGLSSQTTQPYFWDGLLCSGTKMIEVDDNACLCMLGIPTVSTSFNYSGAMKLIEVA